MHKLAMVAVVLSLAWAPEAARAQDSDDLGLMELLAQARAQRAKAQGIGAKDPEAAEALAFKAVAALECVLGVRHAETVAAQKELERYGQRIEQREQRAERREIALLVRRARDAADQGLYEDALSLIDAAFERLTDGDQQAQLERERAAILSARDRRRMAAIGGALERATQERAAGRVGRAWAHLYRAQELLEAQSGEDEGASERFAEAIAREEEALSRAESAQALAQAPQHLEKARVFAQRRQFGLAIFLAGIAVETLEGAHGAEHPAAARAREALLAYEQAQAAQTLEDAERLLKQAREAQAQGRAGEAGVMVGDALDILSRVEGDHEALSEALSALSEAIEARCELQPCPIAGIISEAKIGGEEMDAISDDEMAAGSGGEFARAVLEGLAPREPGASGDNPRRCADVLLGEVRPIEVLRQEAEVAARERGEQHVEARRARLAVARALFRRGDFEASHAALEGLIDAGDGDTEQALALRLSATLHHAQGHHADARAAAERALSMLDPTRAAADPLRPSLLNTLGLVLLAERDDASALARFEEALAARQRLLGADHPLILPLLNNLAVARWRLGQLDAAIEASQRALDLSARSFGERSPRLGTLLSNRALLQRAKGDLAGAAQLSAQALEIEKLASGPTHPKVARAAENLAAITWEQGDTPRTLELLGLALDVQEEHLRAHLYSPRYTEAQKLAFVEDLSRTAETLLSLHMDLAPGDPEAVRLALRGLLLQKGRVLEAIVQSRVPGAAPLTRESVEAIERAHKDLIGTLDVLQRGLNRAEKIKDIITFFDRRLRRVHALLEPLNPASLAGLERWREDYGKLEAELVKLKRQQNVERIEVIRLHRRASSLLQHTSALKAEALLKAPAGQDLVAQVLDRLPPRAALIEFAVARPFDVKAREAALAWGPPRLAAFVLRQGAPIAQVDLGPVAEIDALVHDLRAEILGCMEDDDRCDPEGARLVALERDLGERLLGPLRPLLGDAAHLLVAPDGDLHLLPFEVLGGGQGRYLSDDFQITYLSTGRDLIHFAERPAPREGMVVVANPDYDGGAGAADVGQAGASSRAPSTARWTDLKRLSWPALPGTAAEAEAIAEIFADSMRRLEGVEATETALKALHGPQILHVATHGFFLDQRAPAAGAGGERGFVVPEVELSLESTPTIHQDAMDRAGLVCAGGNGLRGEGQNDGILTAREAAALDLWGTRLVVLSACETGLGESRRGQGVHGLRRALVLAGAESQVLSLWKVSDEATQLLMGAFYAGLREGLGISQAMRVARLTLRSDPRWGHPCFWGAFVLSGDWQTLDRKEPPAESLVMPRVTPGPRGCACRAVASPPSWRGAVALGLLALVGALWRRRSGRARARRSG